MSLQLSKGHIDVVFISHFPTAYKSRIFFYMPSFEYKSAACVLRHTRWKQTRKLVLQTSAFSFKCVVTMFESGIHFLFYILDPFPRSVLCMVTGVRRISYITDCSCSFCLLHVASARWVNNTVHKQHISIHDLFLQNTWSPVSQPYLDTFKDL